jgi:hypothetical protein
MLYKRKQLESLSFVDNKPILERYLYKFHNQRSEFKRLKLHEKDYVFGYMKIIKNDSGENVFDLYKISEAREYVFYTIILNYGEDVAGFNGPLYGPYGKLSALQIRKDKRFFYEYLATWINQLKKGEGKYLMILKPLLNHKLNEIRKITKTAKEFDKRKIYCYAVFFCIYYKARLYFEERNEKFLRFDIQGYTFVANIYTFCHIYARHYVPSLNRGLPNSMNSKIPCIDLDDFLGSIKRIIIAYFKFDLNLNESKEYLLFKVRREQYILWIKFKRMSELSQNKGFEVRSFYKCQEARDLDKFINTVDIEFDKGCYCCYNDDEKQ